MLGRYVDVHVLATVLKEAKRLTVQACSSIQLSIDPNSHIEIGNAVKSVKYNQVCDFVVFQQS